MDKKNIITSSEFDEETHSYKTVKAKSVILKDNYKFVKTNFFYLLFSDTFVGFCVFFISVYSKVFLRSKVVNKKYKREIKKSGAVIVANHVHPLDATVIVSSFYPRRIYPLTLKSNFGLPIVGFIQRHGKCVPIPDNAEQLKRFDTELINVLNKGGKLLVYPEGSLSLYDKSLREFKAGAFRYSAITNTPILPTVTTFRPARGLRKGKLLFTTTYLKPIYPDSSISERANILKLFKETRTAMVEAIDSYYQNETK